MTTKLLAWTPGWIVVPLPDIGNKGGGEGFGKGGGKISFVRFKFAMPVWHPGKDI